MTSERQVNSAIIGRCCLCHDYYYDVLLRWSPEREIEEKKNRAVCIWSSPNKDEFFRQILTVNSAVSLFVRGFLYTTEFQGQMETVW